MTATRDQRPPAPCCVPSKERAAVLDLTRNASAARKRITRGSTEEMVLLPGGAFLMGTDTDQGFPADGEGPVRRVQVEPFWIDRYPVTNRQFEEFVQATGYVTEAERFGWSFVFKNLISPEVRDRLVEDTVYGVEWWAKVRHAHWRNPEGPGSTLSSRELHPVVHVSWADANAYADWAGKRLLTEAEWEFAARGGLEQKLYPWGDELTPEGRHLCNVWQGEFPSHNTVEDGWEATCPVDAFPPNAFGIFSITGNAWEWCADWFHPSFHTIATRVNPTGPLSGRSKVIKGGSYLCHKSYCNRYRVAARSANTPDSSTGNMGFRCARDID